MKRKATLSKSIVYVFLSVWAVGTVYPFLWVVINSFKNKGAIRGDSFSFPLGDTFTLDNYKTAFQRINIGSAYCNSLIISSAVTLAVIVLGGLAAYGLARYEFAGKKVVTSLLVASMMFPVFSTIIPVFRMMFRWGIVNTSSVGLSLLSVILPQIAGNLSFAIFVLSGFMHSAIPTEIEESAYLDGASVFQVFFLLVVPLTRPALATIGIFTFLWSYNDLFTQMFFLRYENTFTITRLLSEVESIAGVNYGLMTAAVVLVVIPVLIVYIFLQRHIIAGMTAGAVKG